MSATTVERTALIGDVGRLFNEPGSRIDAGPLYERLAVEAPVLDLGPIWLVSGYAEIASVAVHPAASSDPSSLGVPVPLAQAGRLADAVARMLPVRDGADHTRLKRLAVSAFSARRVAALRVVVADTVERLLAPRLRDGQLDIVADLAEPLPVAASCAILDVPHEDRELVMQWARFFSRSLLAFGMTDEEAAHIDAVFGELCEYVEKLCDLRARHPGDDLISHLVAAQQAGTLERDELVAFVVMLFANGLETLTSGLAVAVWQLLQHPELLPGVAADEFLAEATFDECVRLGSPVRASSRALLDDVEAGDVTLPRGSVAVLLYAAANRDPRRFPDPHRLDPMRAERRHLGFGYGPHHCLGAPLSLAAGGIVLNRIAAGCRGLRTELTAETAPWNEHFVFAGLRSLPVTFAPVPAPRGA